MELTSTHYSEKEFILKRLAEIDKKRLAEAGTSPTSPSPEAVASQLLIQLIQNKWAEQELDQEAFIENKLAERKLFTEFTKTEQFKTLAKGMSDKSARRRLEEFLTDKIKEINKEIEDYKTLNNTRLSRILFTPLNLTPDSLGQLAKRMPPLW